MKVVIEDVNPRVDGSYDLDPETLTNREYREIKRVSGVRVRELMAAIEMVDMDVVIAFALIALNRAGKNSGEVEDTLLDAEAGKITIQDDTVDDVPPTQPESDAGTGSSRTRSGTSS